MKKFIISLFKSRKEKQIDKIVKSISTTNEFQHAKCVCEMKGVSGYCHEHKTDWI